jgi:hypothetical protein
MVEPLSTGRLAIFQKMMDDAKGDRLAIDALLATAAGDDLPGAIARLEELQANIPERKDGRVRETRIWNDLVIRTGEILDLAIHDLKQLHEKEQSL